MATIRPIKIGSTYQPDTDFDSTVRIPIRKTRERFFTRLDTPAIMPPQQYPQAQPALGVTAVPPAPTSAPQPTATQPAPVPPAPTTTPAPPPVQPELGQQPLPQSYNPINLNFEGQTYQPGVDPTQTTTAYAPNADNVSALLQELENFTGQKLPGDWRAKMQENPQGWLAQLKQSVEGWKQVGFGGMRPDTSLRQRLDDWYAKVEAAVRQTSTSANPEYQMAFLGQQAYNKGLERLKQSGAQGSREDEESLLAMLSSRGLLNSGIAAKELAKFRAARAQNVYDQSAELNQMLLRAELGRLTEKDILTLRAQLERGNEEYLLRLRDKLEDANRGNEWAQIIGAVVGTVGGALLPSASLGESDADFDRKFNLEQAQWATR